MELDITDFVRNADPCEFSASRAEIGNDAAKITWNATLQEAANTQFITADNRDELERWVQEFGAWEQADITAWSFDECNALLIQFISGNLRELESLCFSASGEHGINWRKAGILADKGTISGNIYKGDDGRLYFYMGI